jgi:hypothetical protein
MQRERELDLAAHEDARALLAVSRLEEEMLYGRRRAHEDVRRVRAEVGLHLFVDLAGRTLHL